MLSRVFNSYHSKIDKICSFSSNLIKLVIPPDLKANLMKCVSEMTPLRLFQMERMVLRAEQDSTILMGNTATVASHVEFRDDQSAHYSYDCRVANISHYVYSLIEVLCYQCGFLSWDDFRK